MTVGVLICLKQQFGTLSHFQNLLPQHFDVLVILHIFKNVYVRRFVCILMVYLWMSFVKQQSRSQKFCSGRGVDLSLSLPSCSSVPFFLPLPFPFSLPLEVGPRKI